MIYKINKIILKYISIIPQPTGTQNIKRNGQALVGMLVLQIVKAGVDLGKTAVTYSYSGKRALDYFQEKAGIFKDDISLHYSQLTNSVSATKNMLLLTHQARKVVDLTEAMKILENTKNLVLD